MTAAGAAPRAPRAARAGWPVFRTPPRAARRIGWLAIALGYAAALLGLPLLLGAVWTLVVDALRGTGVTHTAAGPALRLLEGYVEMTVFSYTVSWQGIPVSLVMVLAARRLDLFGWGTAMAAGLVTVVLTLGLLHGMPPVHTLGRMGPPSALLGLAFWVTVRLFVPSAFLRAPGHLSPG